MSESLLQQNKDWNRGKHRRQRKPHSRLNPFSNKTRIETYVLDGTHKQMKLSESLLQQNKDWNWVGVASSDHRHNVWIPSPTKQGLKPQLKRFSSISFSSLNPFSNKTRIETPCDTPFDMYECESESLLQQNKDWNPEIAGRNIFLLKSESLLQQNKDWNSRRTARRCLEHSVWIPSPTKQGLKRKMREQGIEIEDMSESLLQQNKDWN